MWRARVALLNRSIRGYLGTTRSRSKRGRVGESNPRILTRREVDSGQRDCALEPPWFQPRRRDRRRASRRPGCNHPGKRK